MGTAIFAGVMLMAALLFAMLGFWQMERKAWKEELIASSEARANAAPVAVSELGAWESLDVDTIDFQPVTMTGQFLDQAQARAAEKAEPPERSRLLDCHAFPIEKRWHRLCEPRIRATRNRLHR